MKPLLKVPLTNGAIAGALGIALLIALYYLGRHPFLIPVFMDFRILLFGIFLFFTLKELRDLHYSGILYFWQGIIASFLFVVTFAVLASAGIALFTFAVPDFLESYISLTLEQIRNLPKEVVDRIGKDVVESNLKQLPATNVLALANLYLWQSFMIGLFVSIIISVILRRQPKP